MWRGIEEGILTSTQRFAFSQQTEKVACIMVSKTTRSGIKLVLFYMFTQNEKFETIRKSVKSPLKVQTLIEQPAQNLFCA
jgi:hypothetical protein